MTDSPAPDSPAPDSPVTDSPAPDSPVTENPYSPEPPGTADGPDRVERFSAEIADMALPGGAGSRDRALLWVGVALMASAIVVVIVAYVISHSTTNPLQQRDAIVAALIGLTLAVVGAALFVRYSMAQFLRFWMARLSFDSHTATDRLVDAMRKRD